MKTLIDFIKNIKSFYRFYKDYEYNGDDCRFIIANYEKVLQSRTKTLRESTYWSSTVIAEMDKWYEDNWKSMYKCQPIEATKEKIKIISDGETAQVFIDGEKVKCTDMELHFIGHADKKPMITVDAQWVKTDENGDYKLDSDKIGILTEGLKINC